MTRALLEAHPGLVTHLDPDADRRCAALVDCGGVTRRCSQVARWQVQDHAAQCGIHAAGTLRRRLLADAGAGS